MKISKNTNKNILYLILSICTLIVAIYFGYMEMIGQMSVMVIFFLSFLVFGNIDKFVSFKINKNGLEAKMKELDDSLKYTQEIAIFLASTELSTLSRSGHWGRISNLEKEKIKNELISRLKEINIPNNIIEEEVLRYWHEFTILDYYIRIYRKLDSLIKNKPFAKEKDEYKEFEEKFKFDTLNNLKNIEKFNDLLEFIKKYNIANEELNINIDDYKYYLKHKTHRSMERWVKEE